VKLVYSLVEAKDMVKERRWESDRGRCVAGLDMFSKAKRDNLFLIRGHVFNEFPNTRGSLEEPNTFQR